MELLYKNRRVKIFYDNNKNVLVQEWQKDALSSNLFKKTQDKSLESLKEFEQLFYNGNSEGALNTKLHIMFLQWYAFKMPIA